MRRVTAGPVVILTCDPAALDRLWLNEYCPEVISAEARRYPAMPRIAGALGPRSGIRSVPIPLKCTDRFNEAYYGRTEGLLDPEARLACSAWSFVEDEAVDRFERELRHDLESGRWDARHGALRTLSEFDGSLRLVIGRG